MLKLIHVTCAALSISGFFYRGMLKLYWPHQLENRWLKISPHLIDTGLLLTAIAMLIDYHLNPLSQPWLITKITLLLLYILLGFMTLRFGSQRRRILLSFILAILCYAYIVAVALTRQPWPFSDML